MKNVVLFLVVLVSAAWNLGGCSDNNQQKQISTCGDVVADGDITELKGPFAVSIEAHAITLPACSSLQKKLFSPEGGNSKVITAGELEEFLGDISREKGAAMLLSPRVLVNDGESADIQIGSEKDTRNCNLKIKGTVSPDRKSVHLGLDLEYSVQVDQFSSSQSISTEVKIPSNHAIAVAGAEEPDGRSILWLVKPQIVEKSKSPCDKDPGQNKES